MSMEGDMDAAVARELGAILSSLKDMREDISEIKRQTTLTNGRVTALETGAATAAAIAKQRREIGRLAMAVAMLLATIFGGAIATILTQGFAH